MTLGLDEDEAIDRALRMRRSGVLAWAGIPALLAVLPAATV